MFFISLGFHFQVSNLSESHRLKVRRLCYYVNMKVPLAIETKIVAYIARGDKAADIKQEVAKLGYSVSDNQISNIKKRNADALQTIKSALVEKEKISSVGLLERTQRLLGKRLSKAEQDFAELDKAYQDFIDGKISWLEYEKKRKSMPVPTLTELTNVSKEMFHQAQVESGGGDEYANTPDQAKKKIMELVRMVQEGDEVQLERIVFGVKSREVQNVPVPDIQDVEQPRLPAQS